jgi:hypothetical protein
MQRRLQAAVFGAGLATLAACASNVSTDYSPNVGFSQLRRFALVTRRDSASHQLVDDRVRAAVASQLTAKGMTETGREEADVLVGYGVVDHTRTEVDRSDWGWGPEWGWRYYRWGVPWPIDSRADIINTYTDGSVVVCMVDARTHRVVWQGEAADVLSLPVNNPKRADVDIDRAVAKMLDKFPPAPSA